MLEGVEKEIDEENKRYKKVRTRGKKEEKMIDGSWCM